MLLWADFTILLNSSSLEQEFWLYICSLYRTTPWKNVTFFFVFTGIHSRICLEFQSVHWTPTFELCWNKDFRGQLEKKISYLFIVRRHEPLQARSRMLWFNVECFPKDHMLKVWFQKWHSLGSSGTFRRWMLTWDPSVTENMPWIVGSRLFLLLFPGGWSKWFHLLCISIMACCPCQRPREMELFNLGLKLAKSWAQINIFSL